MYEGLDEVAKKILTRIRQPESQRLANGHVRVELVGMIMLSIGAQSAMILIEQSGVIPW